MTSTTQNEIRRLTDAELGELIKMYRNMRQWSQETLSALSKLSVRTIQRVERGEPSDLDTRRALASAFECNDIDVFNKPIEILSPEAIKAQTEQFERAHVTVNVAILRSGKQLADLAEQTKAVLKHSAIEMPRPTQEVYATLMDYFRDYQDIADSYDELSKLEVHDELQDLIDDLSSMGVSLVFGMHVARFGATDDNPGITIKVADLVAFEKGNEPEQIAVPRNS